MKTRLILLIIFLTGSMHSQIQFCSPGAEWHYSFWSMWNISNEFIKYTGDTVVNNQTVKKLKHYRFFLGENGSIPTRLTLIKQTGDTVFMRNIRTGNQWQILYNFAAQPGQGWNNQLSDGQSGLIQSYTKVDSVKQVLVNGQSLKRLYLTYDDDIVAWTGGKLQHQVTELFGSSVFLFPFYCRRSMTDDDWIQDFLCYQDSASGLHQFTSYPCNFTLVFGLESLAAFPAPSFFPNPVDDKLMIDNVLFAPADLVLYNVQGFEARRYSLNSTNQIDLEDLAPGIYLGVVKKNGQVVYKTRIIRN